MSVTRIVTVHCDRCAQWCESGQPAYTANEARRLAKRCGWHLINPGRDICPECWKGGAR